MPDSPTPSVTDGIPLRDIPGDRTLALATVGRDLASLQAERDLELHP